MDWFVDSNMVDNPRSVVRDLVSSWFDISIGRANPDAVSRRLPAPSLPAMPDSINGFAQAYSQGMMGPQVPRTPEPTMGAASPVDPTASAVQAFRAQTFSVHSDAGSEPDINKMAETLENFIEHTNVSFENLQDELHRVLGDQRLKNHNLSTDIHSNDIIISNLTGEHHRMQSRLDRLEATMYRRQTQDEQENVTAVAGQSPVRGQIVDMKKMQADIDEHKIHAKTTW